MRTETAYSCRAPCAAELVASVVWRARCRGHLLACRTPKLSCRGGIGELRTPGKRSCPAGSCSGWFGAPLVSIKVQCPVTFPTVFSIAAERTATLLAGVRHPIALRCHHRHTRRGN